ncbi:putative NAD(P)H nitroreductase ydjA [Hyphomicrobium sp. GJ21]|jgi:nitroreductase|uniref:Putative NAD(P)H nitroreductase n=1 Tax=Hyphomicrobium denitrificans (strain ATCC 51888 / DSM 1869 / NCIMB 11706 / TK 0415) TaxID=582899 RepID=D8JVL2_HYPDA|nr:MULTISPECIES: nitroreductase [Hyphomicrobium]ADJ22901.1 nitroreductase [Hyphomicrobium denitrificans ATCC 51888]MBN9290486.1 nitroreductase [Hyphomicrobium denitrificans]MBN9354185.1 nitroreductase [Hyphomicrobium denitrificans]CEJ85785.1 putative NAD(P)H nitroreductase ydjA [Hyphomicrobium sp. GJ21]
MNTPIFEFLAARRSVKPDRLAAPGPTPEQLRQILTVGARVPDHKKLAPWRFIVFEGDARKSVGEVFAKACQAEESQPPSHVRLDMERERFLRAPLVVAVVSSLKPRPGAPEWEQILSAAAVCYNTCLAANALGFGTTWLTEWIAYSKTVREALGLKESERIAGFLYIGQPMEKPEERERPVIENLITEWTA